MSFLGIISDTHGLVRPEALELLAGAEQILHAGDIGKPEVLERLEKIAPVVAVRGNVDQGAWAAALPLVNAIQFEDRSIYLLHDVGELDLEPTGLFDAVIHGHSHQPRNEVRDGVLWFNPGSAGPRRFRLPVALGRLRLVDDRLEGEILELAV